MHGLLGENGSGKSTLIKVLAGFHEPDAGELRIDGEAGAAAARDRAVPRARDGFVHQDLGLVESLSVVENLRVGAIASSRVALRHLVASRAGPRTRDLRALRGSPRPGGDGRAAEAGRARAARDRARDGGDPLGRPRPRACSILDEPTVFLPREGVERLFSLVRDAAAAGTSILFVSHDLDEVREITDRVTVLRDGALVGTVITAGTSEGASSR